MKRFLVSSILIAVALTSCAKDKPAAKEPVAEPVKVEIEVPGTLPEAPKAPVGEPVVYLKKVKVKKHCGKKKAKKKAAHKAKAPHKAKKVVAPAPAAPAPAPAAAALPVPSSN